MSEQRLIPSNRPLPPILLTVAGICAVLEAIFTLAETAPFGSWNLRGAAMVYGAFWPGLLEGWTPVFPGQRFTMFFSYAFLHGSFLHMLFNMLLMLHLGRQVVARLGPAGFVLGFMLCAAGGGAAFALLNDSGSPMLGASGAVFGLFGMTIYWDIQFRRSHGLPIDQPIRLIIGLVVLNVLLWFLVSGMLAWEAHLGGFVAGAVMARIVTPTPRHRHRVKPRGR